ncbi:MAG: ANTAR domain-containing protein [Verrucomicrobiota bacterium]
MNQETCRILLVDASVERSDALSAALQEGGYSDIVSCDPSSLSHELLYEANPSIVLIDVESPSRDTLEQLVFIRDHSPRPVVLLSQSESVQSIHAAIQSGVSAYITESISPSQARPIIEAAMATFSAFQSLRRELSDTKTQLENRKVIDRAKGIVMKREGVPEDVAYHRMRRFAMDRKLTLADVARKIVELHA